MEINIQELDNYIYYNNTYSKYFIIHNTMSSIFSKKIINECKNKYTIILKFNKTIINSIIVIKSFFIKLILIKFLIMY